MRKEELSGGGIFLVLAALAIILSYLGFLLAANPVGPDSIASVNNSSKAVTSAIMFNVSGGNISTFNITATVQNPRWKGFVGNMTGRFTLDDAAGQTIFDWTLSTVTGRVYATSNSSTIGWPTINCSNSTFLNTENTIMAHSNVNDNITKTFNATNDSFYGTHNAFFVGAVSIGANSCPTLNTYISDVSQNTDFEEMALYSAPNTVYATILEEDTVGYNGQRFDFQMIVPDNGSAGYTSAIPYYVYVELGT
ncbi:MAG TPA: hypothetical protein VJH92_04720 [Candidatus Nanoarchaeia archaeon]|nr:hypothetical protein [Candidatus Nanoarchaeia archaeon]